jgi:hypothetical protein
MRAGQVVLQLKTPWRDGTTHLVMLPLVPRPRLHLICFHGVLAQSQAVHSIARCG